MVLIGKEPLLEATAATNGKPTLTLYGKPGSSYSIEQRTNLLAGPWQSGWRATMTNSSRDFGLAVEEPAEFYRAYEAFTDAPTLGPRLSPATAPHRSP